MTVSRVELRTAIAGFYAVLDRDDADLARELVVGGRASVLQVRLKDAPAAEVVRAGELARRVCDAAGAALVINDRVDVALAVGADGVHLGQTDLPIAEARAMIAALGRTMWIGVSTHDVAQVRAARAAGADYLGFGPVFATRTKANPDPVQGLAGLRAAVSAAGTTPVVAIGGITRADVAMVYATGVAAICAIGAVTGAPDVAEAARAFARTGQTAP